MNYSLFQDIQGLHGNGVVDAVMEFSAQYLLVAVFAVLGLLLLARLRTDGIRQAVRDALWPGGALVLSYLLGWSPPRSIRRPDRSRPTRAGIRSSRTTPGRLSPATTARPRSPSLW